VDPTTRKSAGWQGSYITDPFWQNVVDKLVEGPPPGFHALVTLEDDHFHLETWPDPTGVGSWAIGVNAPLRGRYPSEVYSPGRHVAIGIITQGKQVGNNGTDS